MRFDDLSLRTKVMIPLVGMVIVFSAVITIGAIKLTELTSAYGRIASNAQPAILQTARATRTANSIVREAYGLLSYDPKSDWAKTVTEDFNQSKERGDKAWDAAIALNPAVADKYRSFKDRFDAIYEAAKAPIAIGASIPPLNIGSQLKPAELDQMAKGLKELEAIDRDVTALMNDVQAFNTPIEEANAVEIARLRAASQTTILMMIGLGLAAVVGGLGLAAWMATTKVAAPLVGLADRMARLSTGDFEVNIDGQTRADEVGRMARAVQVFKQAGLDKIRLESEAGQMRDQSEAQRRSTEEARAQAVRDQAQVVTEIGAGLEKLSHGDLTYRIGDAFPLDYEQLRAHFNQAIAQLQQTMQTVVSRSQAIRSGSDEIAQASDNLSRRTEQQAANLEETAAALDEITSTVRRTAEGAAEARKVVVVAARAAERSGEVIRSAVDAMSGIEASSREISQIISVIDEIAFQTNLLALNAGVEAARAGDAGRGFAVVAQEVRALAQRSAEAAKEIKTLISTSADQVAVGVDRVGETGRALEQISTQVAQINGVVTEIAASAEEQSTGLVEVNTAVNQMDQVTQQNAAMVEEATAASHGLREEADALADLIGQFQVGMEVAPQPSTRPVQARSQKVAAAGGGRAAAVASAADAWEEF